MYEILHSEFSKDVYHETVSKKVERWKHDIAWAKEKARQGHDYIKSAVDAGWSIWELTENGRQKAERLIEDLERESSVIRRRRKESQMVP
jgi:hypothetical protein